MDLVSEYATPGVAAVGPANHPLEFQVTWPPIHGVICTLRDELGPESISLALDSLPKSKGPPPTTFAAGVPAHHPPPTQPVFEPRMTAPTIATPAGDSGGGIGMLMDHDHGMLAAHCLPA
jgi:hypothetical protein